MKEKVLAFAKYAAFWGVFFKVLYYWIEKPRAKASLVETEGVPMQVMSFPIGGDGAALSLSVSGGNAVISITVPAKKEVDALLQSLQKSLPAALQPVIAALQAGVDAELGQA